MSTIDVVEGVHTQPGPGDQDGNFLAEYASGRVRWPGTVVSVSGPRNCRVRSRTLRLGVDAAIEKTVATIDDDGVATLSSTPADLVVQAGTYLIVEGVGDDAGHGRVVVEIERAY